MELIYENGVWQSFYLSQVRGPAERLMNSLDSNAISFAQLSKMNIRRRYGNTNAQPQEKVWFGDRSEIQSYISDPLFFDMLGDKKTGTEMLIEELLNLSHSNRLQEALSACPRACREQLEIMRETVLARLNFLQRMKSMSTTAIP